MNAYTFERGNLVKGIAVQQHDRFGVCVFLGEEGRGRRFEAISLDRRNPATVENGRVLQAHVNTVTVPPKDGKPERTFFTLMPARPEESGVLVRINTGWVYTRDSTGTWKTMAGEPRVLVSGHGAQGIAGRIGSWVDSLVIMHPGDLIRIKPEGGYKTVPYALWVDEAGVPQCKTWEDYERIVALAEAQAEIAEAKAEENALQVVAGTMPAYTWQRGRLFEGLELTTGATGPVLGLGAKGRARKLIEVPIIGTEPSTRVQKTGLVILKHEGDKIVYGLSQAPKAEKGFMVRVNTNWVYTRGAVGQAFSWKGVPQFILEGWGAYGDAGGIGKWSDYLVVLHEGDVLYVRPDGGRKTSASVLRVEKGNLITEDWATWKAVDAQRDPQFYIAKGQAPKGHVPQDWIGRVVTVKLDEANYPYEQTGELLTAKSVSLNLGWDRKDFSEWPQEPKEHYRGRIQWVVLEKDKEVRRLEGVEADTRQRARNAAEAAKSKLNGLKAQPWYEVMDKSGIFPIDSIDFDTAPTEGWGSLDQWTERAQKEIREIEERQAEAERLYGLVQAGQIIVNWRVWHRRGGKTMLGDGWVIQPDGTIREPDAREIPRHKSDGHYVWRLVKEDELAIWWHGESNGEVVKLPVTGVTEAQLETVTRIETEELGQQPNIFGLNSNEGNRQKELMKAIVAVLKRQPFIQARDLPELDFHLVTGDGQRLFGKEDGFIQGGRERSLLEGLTEDSPEILNRQAALRHTEPVVGGNLEFWVTLKHSGQWPMVIRWVQINPDLVSQHGLAIELNLAGRSRFGLGESEQLFTLPLDHWDKPCAPDASTVSKKIGLYKRSGDLVTPLYIRADAGETAVLELLKKLTSRR